MDTTPQPIKRETFARKFAEGPFTGLCFRELLRDATNNTITLEFYGGRQFTIPVTDFNQWREVDVGKQATITAFGGELSDDELRAINRWLAEERDIGHCLRAKLEYRPLFSWHHLLPVGLGAERITGCLPGSCDCKCARCCMERNRGVAIPLVYGSQRVPAQLEGPKPDCKLAQAHCALAAWWLVDTYDSPPTCTCGRCPRVPESWKS